MREIDMYVSLIDDDEADNILKAFNDSIKFQNLQFKRIKVQKILKGLNMKMTPKKKTSPFNFVIQRHDNYIFKNFSEMQFFILMQDPRTDNIPQYEKFANALIYFPEVTKELLPRMEANLSEGKPIFNLGYRFETEDELNEYIINTSIFSNNELTKDFINSLEVYISEDDKEQINSIIEDIGKWSLQEFYNNLCNNVTNLQPYLIQYAFLKSHVDIGNNVQIHLLLETLSELMFQYKKVNDKLSKGAEAALDGFENEKELILKLHEDVKKYKYEAVNYKKEISDIQKENKKLIKQIDMTITKEKAYEKSINDLENKVDMEVQKYEKETEKLKKSYVNIVKNLEREKEKAQKQVSLLDSYLEYAFSYEDPHGYLFAIVYAIEIKIAKSIYPEILFIPIDDWENQLPKNKGVLEVFIQREGIHSTQINSIEEFSVRNNIKSKIINAGNEKKLIETIAILKNRMEEI